MENYPFYISGERIAEMRRIRGRFEEARESAREFRVSELCATNIASEKIGIDAMLAVEELIDERSAAIDFVDRLMDLVGRIERRSGRDDGELHG